MLPEFRGLKCKFTCSLHVTCKFKCTKRKFRLHVGNLHVIHVKKASLPVLYTLSLRPEQLAGQRGVHVTVADVAAVRVHRQRDVQAVVDDESDLLAGIAI